jgi:hypothetical protein
MWDFASDSLSSGRARRYAATRDGRPLPYGKVLQLWQEDEAFRGRFVEILAEAPFGCYRWETPPLTAATAERPFEFVLLDEPGLDQPADRESFGGQFTAAGDGETVLTFPNLGGDAILVVPCPVGPASAHAHLAAFVRHAPTAQVHALWRAVGTAMAGRLDHRPVWLSTAGMGVAWLHVRLDARPKYYGFRPYAQA